MSESGKSDHDLLIEINTRLGVMHETMRELQRQQSAQALFNRALEQRVNTIEADRAAKIPVFLKLESTVDDHNDQLLRIETTAKNAKLLVVGAWAILGSAMTALLLKVFGLIG